LFDLPFAVYRQGLLIDVPGGASRDIDIVSGQWDWNSFYLIGHAGSAYESYVWQEALRLDAVSTVRGIQFARDAGIEVLKLTSANWAANSAKFTSNGASLNLTTSLVNSVKVNYIDQGYTVTIPRSLIHYGDWTGLVFIAEKNDTVARTMSATFAINKNAGGYTIAAPIIPNFYDISLNAGYVTSSPSFSSISNSTTMTNGATSFATWGGDPVNMVTGNMYHTERDLTIKSRGGLPIVFERSYNSREPADGPLGFGWTHSFNHYLRFNDDNMNDTVDAGDTDGITSSVSWVDGTGAEKSCPVTGNSGGVPIGAAFTNPEGVYVTVQRVASGSYTITEKNGMTYTFESASGTVWQTARLKALSDRNSNTLSQQYTNAEGVASFRGADVTVGNAAIATGDNFTCALTSTGAVQCWGSNVSGQLGNGTTIDSSTPVAVSGLSSGVMAVAAGGYHTCAMTNTGTVKCWGNNYFGQLGNGTTINSTTPVTVSGLTSGMIAVAAGALHTCALTNTGAVKCWGYNNRGQLGNGTTIDSSTPVVVSGLTSGVIAVTAGGYHTCALINTGAVKCWGYNVYGQLGNGATINSSTPVAVSGLTSGVIAIETGILHTCALTSTGAVKCWGYNYSGQLGNGTKNNSSIPVEVSGLVSGVMAIATGVSHTCALTNTGAVKCWGLNNYGQLGDGTYYNSSTPIVVSGLASGVTVVAGGDSHTCALTSSGMVQCWGRNTAGQAGSALTSITDGLGRKLTLSYSNGHIDQLTDWSGRTWQYAYDADGNLTSVSNPPALAGEQSPVTYTYYTSADGASLNHTMKRYQLPRGNGMTFEYYSNGRVFRHTDDLGNTNTFRYNDFRRETVQVSERGFTRQFFFDKYGNPLRIVEENGAENEYTYDATHYMNRVTSTDPMGKTTSYGYDGNGNVTLITLPSGNTQTLANFSFGQPGKVKDARGNYTLFKFDTKGNAQQSLVLKSGIGASIDPTTYTPVPSDLVAWNINTYDSYGNLTVAKRVRDFTTQAGPTLEYTYDASGLNATTITRRGDKDGVSPTYDTLGRVKTGLDGDWQAISMEYDVLDRVTRATDAVGLQRDYFYDENGNLKETRLDTLVDGILTRVDSSAAQYDLADRRTHATDAGGFVRQYQYDEAGNVVSVTNPDNYTIGIGYDAANRAVMAYDAEGHNVSTALDITGRTRSVVDPNGNAKNFEFYGIERDGRLKYAYDALNRKTTFDYDANGNRASVTDNLNRTSSTSYDELNRPVRVVGTLNYDERPVFKYSYDNLGNLTQIGAGHTDASGTNPASDVTTVQETNQFDDFGRLLKKTDALNRTWSFTYDLYGNVLTRLDPKGQTTTYTWDYGHQLKTRTGAGNSTTTYTRNALGQVVKAQSPDVTYTYTYDNAHRLATVTDSRGNKTLSYEYSPGGWLDRLDDNEGRTTQYLYDPVGRLAGIWAPNWDYTSYVYDAGGRLTEKWLPNGVNSQYQYNTDDTLKQLKNRVGYSDSNILTQHDYIYDGVGNRQTHTEKIGTTTTPYKYVYDELNRLKETRNNTSNALIESANFDPLHNRTTRSDGVTTWYAITDSANQLTELHSGSSSGPLTHAFIYDNNGNLTKKCEGTGVTKTASDCGGSVVTTLTYDALDQLTQVTKTGLPSESYKYDDQGRRIQKTVGSSTTNYLYNGPDVYAEYGSSWTSASAYYVHGPNMDDPIARTAGTTTQYYHQDGLGSVVALSGSTGATDATRRYDAWGNILASTGTIPAFGYTGREPDASGLVYYRARYYDPSIGRFTQRDPIGLSGAPIIASTLTPIEQSPATRSRSFLAQDADSCVFGCPASHRKALVPQGSAWAGRAASVSLPHPIAIRTPAACCGPSGTTPRNQTGCGADQESRSRGCRYRPNNEYDNATAIRRCAASRNRIPHRK
jgi:RHS repeat-associated protein